MLKIHQAIWGYSNGHRLLASSMPLSNQSIKILEPLSDLSGPEMISPFDGYLTGYPLLADNLYALSKTWYASEMRRPGCVWTHTLFLEYKSESELKEINIDSLFRRPDCATENWLSYYTHPVEPTDASHLDNYENVRIDLNTCVSAIDMFSLITKVFSPIVVSADNNISFNKGLLLLLSEVGVNFFRDVSFSTGSLSNRIVNRFPLDLQIAPSSIPKVAFRTRQNDVLFVNEIRENNHATEIEEILKATDTFYSTKAFVLMYGRKYYNRNSWEAFRELYSLINNVEKFSISSEISILQKYFNNDDASSILAKTLELQLLENIGVNIAENASMRFSILFDFLTNNSSLFDHISHEVNEALINVIDRLWINSRCELLDILLKLMQSDLNAAGEEAVKYLSTIMGVVDYAQILAKNPLVGVVLIRFNWRLALCRDIWKQSKNIQIEVLRELRNRNIVCDSDCESNDYRTIIRTILKDGKFDLSEELYKTFHDDAIDVFFELGNSPNRANDLIIRRWCGLFAKNQILSIGKLNQTTNIALFSAAVDVLDPYDDALLEIETIVWEQLYKKYCRTSIRPQDTDGKYAQFVLPIILKLPDRFTDEFVRFVFLTVHKILANDDMDYSKWEKLSELLPPVVWYNSWDKCKRLRKAAYSKKYSVVFNDY